MRAAIFMLLCQAFVIISFFIIAFLLNGCQRQDNEWRDLSKIERQVK